MGWQLKVYWKEDGLFYGARCIAYDTAAGTHELQYEDGESERLALREEALKWLQPPAVRPALTQPLQLFGVLSRRVLGTTCLGLSVVTAHAVARAGGEQAPNCSVLC